MCQETANAFYGISSLKLNNSRLEKTEKEILRRKETRMWAYEKPKRSTGKHKKIDCFHVDG